MKCVLVFNSFNDIVFCSADKEFTEYINRHALGSHLADGDDDHISDELNHDILVQVFSPLVTSQQVLFQNRDGYKVVKTETGLTFVLQDYSGYLFIAVSNDKEESEAELQRKLAIFHSLLQFLFGPILEELRLDTQTERDIRWQFISSLLTEWSVLRSKEQSFLVEAVEQLQVNSSVNYKCVNLLETVAHKLQGVIEEDICHMILLVNTKQLALYSKSSELLEARDILMMMLLSQVLHGEKMNQSDNIPFNELHISDEEDSDKSCHTPESSSNKCPSEADSSDTSSQFYDDDSEELKDTMVSSQEYHHKVVFLQTNSGLYPHSLHSIHIMDGVILVMLCQPKLAQISAFICQALNEISRLQTFRDFSKKKMDTLDIAIRKILDLCKRFKNKFATDKIVNDLQARWDSCKSNGLFTFFRTLDKEDMTARLENALTNLGKCLKDLFSFLFLHPGSLISPINSTIMHTIIECQARVRFCIADYKDFLMVKAQQNYTISLYLEKLPGLVHFIYVNRNRDFMVAPSIIVQKQEGKFDTSIIVKNKIWKMVNFVQGKLHQCYLSVNWKDGDFFFSYYLWFEDKNGLPLEIKSLPHSSHNFPLPGILSGNFYKSLVNSCFPGSASSVVCQELFCIHMGLVNSSYVTNQISTLLHLIHENVCTQITY